jgi:hypothetical protein
VTNVQPCKFECGIPIIYLGQNKEKKGSTGFYEVINGKITDTEHTFKRCESIRTTMTKLKDAMDKVKKEHGGGLDVFNNNNHL